MEATLGLRIGASGFIISGMRAPNKLSLRICQLTDGLRRLKPRINARVWPAASPRKHGERRFIHRPVRILTPQRLCCAARRDSTVAAHGVRSRRCACRCPLPIPALQWGEGAPKGRVRGSRLFRTLCRPSPPALLLFARSDSPAGSRSERAGIASAAQIFLNKTYPRPCRRADTPAHLAVTARAQARWAFRER